MKLEIPVRYCQIIGPIIFLGPYTVQPDTFSIDSQRGP